MRWGIVNSSFSFSFLILDFGRNWGALEKGEKKKKEGEGNTLTRRDSAKLRVRMKTWSDFCKMFVRVFEFIWVSERV